MSNRKKKKSREGGSGAGHGSARGPVANPASRPGGGLPRWAIILVVVIAGAFFLFREDKLAQPGSGESGSAPKAVGGKSSAAAPPVRHWEPEPEAEAFAKYAGSQSCKECHAEAFNDWMGSDHQLAERLPNGAMDGPAFDPPREYQHAGQTTRLLSTNGVFRVETRGLSGERERFPVARVIGETPLRQFLIPFPRGRLQTLDATYDPHTNEWFNVYGEEDRQPGEWGHWTGRGMSWNTQCASCHNTRLRKNYDHATDTYHTSMAEMSVGCEACHGPMKAHVDWRQKYPDTPDPDPTLKPFDRNQWVDTCGMCHSRRTELTGDFVPGDNYLDHFSHVIPNETDIYYADGQVRDENYVYTSFLSSRMHHAGVSCVDCHQPHTGKTLLPGNVLCMKCHTAPTPEFPTSPVIDAAAHSHHSISGAGGQCVNCHMPQTTYMQRDPRRDHGFTIPDPLLTKEHGIPNACNRCHTDKDVDWAIAAVDQWYGPKMDRPTRTRARWVAGARAGDPGTRNNLLQMLQTEPMPFWQAVAAELLDPWIYDPEVAEALLTKVSSTNALLRGTAALTLGPLVRGGPARVEGALRTLLHDPVRKVRVDAAWALRDRIDMSSEAASDLRRSLDFSLDMPTGSLQKGVFHLDRQETDKALKYIEWSIKLDGYSAPLRHEHAIVLSMMGRGQDAIAALHEAIRLDPSEAEYQYKLGLAYHEVGQPEGTVAALEEAVRLDPRHSRAWYNLGLMRNQMQQPDAAVFALEQAEAAEPNDPEIPYALATVLASIERRQDAIAAAKRALQIAPNYGPARGLLQQLGN